jgi:predicted Zn-dependent protease
MIVRISALVVPLLCAGCAATANSQQAAWLSGVTGPSQALVRSNAAERLEQRCGGCCTDADAQKTLVDLAARLVAGSRLSGPIECRVLRSPAINAYSLPGRIYVTRGLTQRLADEHLLAAALAHEIAHLEAEHRLRPLHGNAAELHREIAADRRAMELLAGAGFSKGAMLDLLDKIRDELDWESYVARAGASR